MKSPRRKSLGKTTFRLALAYLLLVIAVVWGFAIGRYEVFPFEFSRSVYHEITAFVDGGPEGSANVWRKIAHELDMVPGRFMVEMVTPAERLEPVTTMTDVFSKRRELPLFHTNGVRDGYYLIQGYFDFQDAMPGLLAINAATGQVARHWVLPSGARNNSYPQGMDLFPDGSIYSSAPYRDAPSEQSVGNRHNIVGLSWCGEELLNLMPNEDFHHSVNKDGDSHFWTWDGRDFVKFNKDSGGEKDRFSIFDVMAANSEIHAFEMRMKGVDGSLMSLSEENFLDDPFHANDIDPLPGHLSPAFPGFESGDLLVSFRELNLVFVLRPTSRKVIWYSQGQVSRQHDPEWNNDGTITVYNNKPYHGNSNIEKIDVRNGSMQTAVNGEKFSILGRARGDHTVLPDGSFLILATEQGRMLHVSNDGEVLEAEFVNRFDDRYALRIFNAEFVSASEYEKFEASCE